MKLVLANVDYRSHVTDEGDQLQVGLERAGWTLAGAGYGDDCRDVGELLERHRPEAVLVSDPRDWDPHHDGSFRKDIGFERIAALRSAAGVLRAVVLKDAGSVQEYQRRFAEAAGVDALVVYYLPEIVCDLNPWARTRRIVRTYHSVDRATCDFVGFPVDRRRAVVSGATSAVYPVRERVMRAASRRSSELGIDAVRHPGYGNGGCRTPAYLELLAGYRVHVATASRYGFALRKIIESVAMGATPVTNLPTQDELPEIDGALVRISANAGLEEVLEAVAAADRAWELEERRAWAEKARSWYDWRAIGLRLDEALVGRAREVAA